MLCMPNLASAILEVSIATATRRKSKNKARVAKTKTEPLSLADFP